LQAGTFFSLAFFSKVFSCMPKMEAASWISKRGSKAVIDVLELDLTAESILTSK
jgi:hypothetical protein